MIKLKKLDGKNHNKEMNSSFSSFTLKEQITSVIELARKDTVSNSEICRPDSWYAGQIIQAIEKHIDKHIDYYQKRMKPAAEDKTNSEFYKIMALGDFKDDCIGIKIK